MLKLLLFFGLILSVAISEDDLSRFENLKNLYEDKQYAFVVEQIDLLEIEKKIKSEKDLARLLYLRGASYHKINEFEKAVKNLLGAIKFKYVQKDLFYMIGQSYFALENYDKARFFFKKSVEKKFKIAVSLYYAAFSSYKVKDNKTAAAIYTAIEKLPLELKKDVLQASRMQIADIYYKQAEKLPGAFRAMKKYVIPQYQKAYEADKNSNLAKEIEKKIKNIQQKYDLVLFRMRNGRLTARPPYFLQASLSVGQDSNVNLLDEDDASTADSSELAALSSTTSFFGRYSFYPNSKYSISPDLNLSYTQYHSDEDSIKANNTYSASLGMTATYEHFYFKRPATTFLRFAFTHSAIDADSDSSFSEDANAVQIVLSEELRFLENHPTTLRILYDQNNSKEDARDVNLLSFIIEHVFYFKHLTNYTYFSYDRSRYGTETTEDQNSFLLRNDFIFPSVKNWFNLGFFLSFSRSNYINDDARGTSDTLGYGLNINRPIGKKWYLSLDYLSSTEEFETQSNIVSNKYILSLDYIY